MRLRKPTRAIVDQVRITREGNDAIIDYADAGIAGTRLTIGPDIATMTDREIIDVFNGILAAQERLLAAWDKTSPKNRRGRGRSTTTKTTTKAPRGDVLRCIIDDGGPNGEVIIHVDDQELSLAEFGRLLRVHAGWGMRIAFVPDQEPDRQASETRAAEASGRSGGSTT